MRHAPLVVAYILVASAPAYAQAVASPSAPASADATTAFISDTRFRGGVDLVPLEVCVRNREGRPIAGLKPADFLVLENNVPQQIVLFSAEGRVPLAVTILLDSSHSMAGARFERAKAAAAELIGILRPGDLVEVISFNQRANLRYVLGADHEEAKLSLNGISPTGMTGLYEATLVAVRRLDRARQTQAVEYRQVLIVLSDGEDTSSVLPFESVLEDVRRSNVLLYAISLLTEERDRTVTPRSQMARLARDTGGRAITVRDLGGLSRIYQEIAVELVHLYRLAYVPSPAVRDGSWRTVSVRTSTKDAMVQTRSGYYAPRAPRSLHQKRDR